jgi:hypothetical protein
MIASCPVKTVKSPTVSTLLLAKAVSRVCQVSRILLEEPVSCATCRRLALLLLLGCLRWPRLLLVFTACCCCSRCRFRRR